MSHGKLLRIAGCQTFEPQPADQLVLPRWIETTCDTRLKCKIITNRQTRDEVELLEYDPQGFAPKRGPVKIRKRRHQDAIQPDLAVIGLIKSSNEMQECTLSATGLPISAKVEPAFSEKSMPFENRQRPLWCRIRLFQADNAQQRGLSAAQRGSLRPRLDDEVQALAPLMRATSRLHPRLRTPRRDEIGLKAQYLARVGPEKPATQNTLCRAPNGCSSFGLPTDVSTTCVALSEW